MVRNNKLLKDIAENTGSNDTEGHHTDNYYLKRIEENTANGISGGGGSGGCGDYNDLTNKPTIPTDVSDLTDNSNTTFTPKSHTHNIIDISGFSTIEVTITFTDSNQDTINLVTYTQLL